MRAAEGGRTLPGPARPAPDGEERPLLALHGITKRFGPTLALDGVSVAFRGGEVHALVGENGAGKSTLLNIIAGVIRPDPPSRMEIDGQSVSFAHYSPRAAQVLGISIVPQESALIEAMTVAENIFLGREPRLGPVLKRGEMFARAEVLLRRLGANFGPDVPVERLSVAQAQLVEIARALALESRVVAMDEPSAVLAGDELEGLFRIIHQLTSDGVAVIYVSHRLDEVFDHCDRFTVLKDGRLVETGPVGDVRRDELIRMMVGREVSDVFPPPANNLGRVRLRVSRLSVKGKLRGIDLEVREGEILGIAGLMGSGRTTLAKAVFGAIPVSDETRVWVDGVEGPFRSPAQALKAGLAYVPEDRTREGLATRKTVRWNLTLLGLRRILQGPLRLIRPRTERALVQAAVTRFSIRTSPTGDDVIAKLSGGNQQKVVLAKWLEASPRVLILDEPTRGIDVGTKQEIYRLLRQLATEGLAIVVISSDLIEILGLADRIVVVCEGRIAGELEGRSATEEAVMRLATASEDVKP
ncbi:MAG TPA: sugar ABC transporter ATP-binding protein [Actinomycetota bacterium]|nr:sugar ABC transporter ATP-binding protein [Actinomycetota bacterium]